MMNQVLSHGWSGGHLYLEEIILTSSELLLVLQAVLWCTVLYCTDMLNSH